MATQNLPQDKDDVVIVPADRLAYPEYLKHSVYICQRGKPIREHVLHMGFYADRAIQIHVPCIYYREDDIAFTYEEAARRRTGQDRTGIGVLARSSRSPSTPAYDTST